MITEEFLNCEWDGYIFSQCNFIIVGQRLRFHFKIEETHKAVRGITLTTNGIFQFGLF
jgi:hypothetical protein